LRRSAEFRISESLHLNSRSKFFNILNHPNFGLSTKSLTSSFFGYSTQTLASILATYTNLNPGTYVVRVQGSNSDGVWNEKGASLSILITPPWWGTT
jgi:hypothetical protein